MCLSASSASFSPSSSVSSSSSPLPSLGLTSHIPPAPSSTFAFSCGSERKEAYAMPVSSFRGSIRRPEVQHLPPNSTHLAAHCDAPDDIMLLIFSFLRDTRDRNNVSLVCKRWLRMESLLRHKIKLNAVTGHFEMRKQFLEVESGMDSIIAKLLERVLVLKEIEIVNFRVPAEAALTDHGLSLIGCFTTQLEKFQLRVSSCVTSHGIAALTGRCGRTLTEIELVGCMNVGGDALTAIAKNCVKLKALTLKACMKVDDEALRNLAESRCRESLERLDVALCPVTDDGVKVATSSFPSLVSLDISYCVVTDQSLIHMAAKCRLLQRLHLRGCLHLTDISLEAIVGSCPAMRELDVRRARNISSSGIEAVLRSCQVLEKLWMEECILSRFAEQLAIRKGVELAIYAKVAGVGE